MSVRLKISPPWITYINKIQALFDGDPQIACNINEDGRKPKITLACNNGNKVTALMQILPKEVKFGNVTLKIEIDGVPADIAFKSKKDLFETVFEKNPAFAYAIAPAEEGYYWIDVVYVVFKNCVVQFFNDNLDDCHGVISTLYQNIAEDIFLKEATNGVYFNTDVERGNLGKPLGEWP